MTMVVLFSSVVHLPASHCTGLIPTATPMPPRGNMGFVPTHLLHLQSFTDPTIDVWVGLAIRGPFNGRRAGFTYW